MQSLLLIMMMRVVTGDILYVRETIHAVKDAEFNSQWH